MELLITTNTVLFMKQLFTFLTIILLTGYASFAQEKKILFIGNSFTAANDLQGIVHQFFDLEGTPVHTYAYAPGGISVGDVHMGTAAHMNNPAVFDLIRDTDWDYVVLQDNQGRFSLDSGKFPNPVLSKVVEGHLKIRDSLHYYHPCAKMIWFSGWGFKDVDVEMIDSITVNYRVLNDSAKDVIAPIGSAWKNTIIARPSYELWSPDGAHPDVTGSYLTAAVIYGTIGGKDITLNPFNHILPPPDATFLKSMAQKALTDPVVRKKSNLEGISSVDISWTDPLLSGPAGYKTYRWYLGNKLAAATTVSSWMPSLSGTYRLWALDAAGYWHKSCSQEVTVTTGIDGLSPDQLIATYPNPAEKTVHITGLNDAIKTIRIYALTGSLQQVFDRQGNEMSLDISALASGMYLIRCFNNDNQVTGVPTRFVKQ